MKGHHDLLSLQIYGRPAQDSESEDAEPRFASAYNGIEPTCYVALKACLVALNSRIIYPPFKSSLQKGFLIFLCRVKTEYCRTLKKLALCNFTKSKWVEQYNLLKDVKGKSSNGGSVVLGGPNAIVSSRSTSVKRSRDSQFQNFPR
ncbi:hypothetical protein LOK49_LG10G02053 [Camellia lanceoleosa]|uniref:Uncharacterized protein n=1 Tax=Camellia lanceoleosa TaxID=1840588 RepID=A0ACC0GDW8_9ERIC|nr:hypothetical protein LOK49_LG10G02053 [Camellia lanceoleosa]